MDYLGNPRLAYRVGQGRTYATSLNLDNAEQHRREARQFDSLSVNAPVAQRVGAALARTDEFVALLNASGANPQPPGPAAATWGAKRRHGTYRQPVEQHGFPFSLGAFLVSILQPAVPPPTGTDGIRGRRGLPLLQIAVAAGLPALAQLGGDVLKGYLHMLVFDRDSALVGQQTQQLNQLAFNSYEALRLQIVLPQDSHATAYVGDESNADVLFDDASESCKPKPRARPSTAR